MHEIVHAPATQPGTAFARAGHSIMHPPQLVVESRTFVSQPSLRLPLQLPKPTLQVATAHTPAAHAAIPFGGLQERPQLPQSVMLVRVSTSQPLAGLPSQSAKPVLHVKLHAPDAQKMLAFARVGHARPQPPQ
ncbi:MAG: hypothetical protein IPF99_30940 [Deltaproteobacteria bacterium]|nr:hypothetical protein [Deltaproteobacteria bacterium]